MGELHVNLRPVERAITRDEHPVLGEDIFYWLNLKKMGIYFFQSTFNFTWRNYMNLRPVLGAVSGV